MYQCICNFFFFGGGGGVSLGEKWMTPNITIHGFHKIIHKLLPAYHKITEKNSSSLFLYNRQHELRPILAKAVSVFLVHWMSRFISFS